MKQQLMTPEEMENHYVGEAITLTAVMALVAVAVMAVVIIVCSALVKVASAFQAVGNSLGHNE